MLERSDEPPLDRLIHEPARLAIMTVLSAVKSADFVFLLRTTALTKGNLSSHLTKLEEAGLVKIEKTFVDKKPNTRVVLTAVGKESIAHHWDQLDRLKSFPDASSAIALASLTTTAPRVVREDRPNGRGRRKDTIYLT